MAPEMLRALSPVTSYDFAEDSFDKMPVSEVTFDEDTFLTMFKRLKVLNKKVKEFSMQLQSALH
jgi:hypothetical protein